MLGSVTASGSSRGRDEYLRSPGEPSVCSTSCLSPPVARYSKPWPANIRPASAPTRSTTADAWFPPRERAETLPTLWTSSVPAEAHVRANHARMRLFASLLGMFTLGGVVGAAGFKYFGFVWVVPLAAIILGLSLPPLWTDLHRLRAVLRQALRIRDQGKGQSPPQSAADCPADNDNNQDSEAGTPSERAAAGKPP